jgi:hypothetical protein
LIHEGKHPYPANSKNWVWLFCAYDKDIDKEKAQCLLCGKLLKYISEGGNENPSTLSDHLRGPHKMKYEPKDLVLVVNKPKAPRDMISFLTPKPTRLVPVPLERIVLFFVRAGIARNIFAKRFFKEAFPQDVPQKSTKHEFECAIAETAKRIQQNIRETLKCTVTNGEMDGSRKANKDFTTFILSGFFLESFVLKHSESNENMVKFLCPYLSKVEKENSTTIFSMLNDNCIKIDAPMHQACCDIGIVHGRCISHTVQLALGDIFISRDLDLQALLQKIGIITHVIMKQKENTRRFLDLQLEFKRKNPVYRTKILLHQTKRDG